MEDNMEIFEPFKIEVWEYAVALVFMFANGYFWAWVTWKKK